jgi:flagellar assembly protein FliH
MKANVSTTARETHDFDRLIEQAYRELESSRRIAQGIISNARDEAAEMVTRAKAQATKMVAEAQDRAEESVRSESERAVADARKAYEEGFTQGLTHGEEEGRRRFDAILAKVGGILDYLTREREKILAGCRHEMVELILRISDRVIRIEQETIRALLAENLKLLLEESAAKDEMVLHLNPADVTEVQRVMSERTGPMPRHKVASDPAVPVGEARVRSRSLNVDLSFARRFEAIRDRLLARFGPTIGSRASVPRIAAR